MANFSKGALLRIGRMLDGGSKRTPLTNLMAWSRVPRKSIYNWTLAPEDPQYRTMPPIAKRMVALLAYFALTGQLTQQRLADIEALEAALENEEGLQKLARRVSRVLASGIDRAAAPEAALPEDEESGAEAAEAADLENADAS